MRARIPRAPARIVPGLLAALLVLAGGLWTPAFAQDIGQAPVVEGASPGPEPAAEPGAPEPAPREEDVDISARIPSKAEASQFWHLLAIYELHVNLFSDEYSANDAYNWYMLQAKFDLSRHDQVGVRAELLQRYVADPGENGVFFGDLRFYYWRKFTIPIEDFPIPGVAGIYLTAPTSRESQARSYVTRPTLLLTFAPSYEGFTLLLTGIYRYSFARFAESAEGSSPNERQTAGLQAQLMYQPLPWLAPSFLWQSWWSESYPAKDGSSQGWRGSSYYFEFALNFSLPMPDLWPGLDLSVAYGQGAPMLTGGTYRFAFYKRDQSEFYFGLNLTY